MRVNDSKPSLPPESTRNGSIADDLVDLAKADAVAYRSRRESARSVVRIAGAPDVLQELRHRLDEVLDHLDPAVGAVALASTIATLTSNH
ncbi:hypothetical protein [Gordonia hongkongensis]|uniref:hypothetical protein n=1 Tax=Gordonia hongkongensis TaxID=1701090 RepID=UPI003D758392